MKNCSRNSLRCSSNDFDKFYSETKQKKSNFNFVQIINGRARNKFCECEHKINLKIK